MTTPTPISPANVTVRCRTAFDLELTLVKFLTNLFGGTRLDNPTVSLAQPATVPYDYTERAEALDYKVPPKVVRGRIPRTLTGEVALDKISDVPVIIVQSTGGKINNAPAEMAFDRTTTRILFVGYDENPDSQGYQDILNLIETAKAALTSFGQGGLDNAYPILFPIEWKIDSEAWPHFIGEISCDWQLPSTRPMPDMWDAQAYSIPIPGEWLETRQEAMAS
jgi:hypothetical protein